MAEEGAELLDVDVNERSLTHRLAVHLEREFEGWHVDCEYNRKGHDPKVLDLPIDQGVPSNDTEARTVFPDVIIHRRNSNANLVVIEARKEGRNHGLDQRTKLRAYVEQLGYRYAIYVLFRKNKTIDFEFV